MKRSIAKFKEEARDHEQREDWLDAINAYQRALKVAEKDGDGEDEIGLYNRIGDLYLREKKLANAVEYYELAADRYEAAGLISNAIAVCNKVIRHDPNRPEPYAKLARLTLAQGFLNDAHDWSVEYADRMIRAGRRGDAFVALGEFADEASDPELRERLARYLLEHGETDVALAQLLKAYRAYLQGGTSRADQARALRERILGIDPDQDLAAFEKKSAAEAEGQDRNGDRRGAPIGSARSALPSLGLETAADSAGIEDSGAEGGQTEDLGLETTRIADPVAEPVMGPGDPTSLGLLDPDSGVPGPGAGADDGLEFGTIELGSGEPPPLPLLDDLEAPPEIEIGMDRIEAVEIPVEPAFEPLDILPPLSTDDSEEPAVPEPAVPEPAPVDLPKVEAAVPIPAPEAAAQGSTTDYIDLGSLLLDAETRETGETRYMVETPESTGDEDQDFMELLAQFRSKVSEHLGDEDMESRYDLGLAFKEMGLVDEAISQFQFALRGLDDKLKIYEELGDCFMLKGDYTVALKILKGALRHPDTVPGDLIGVHYKLGRSYEEIGRTMEARDAYERVIALDLGFRDAASRLSRL